MGEQKERLTRAPDQAFWQNTLHGIDFPMFFLSLKGKGEEGGRRKKCNKNKRRGPKKRPRGVFSGLVSILALASYFA